MPDVFLENMRRYRLRESEGVGGPYGQAAPELLGWSPSLEPVRIDDMLGLSGAAPDTNQYANPYDVNKTKVEHYYNGSTVSKWKLVLRAETPFSVFAGFSARITSLCNIYGGQVQGVYGIHNEIFATFNVFLITAAIPDLTVPTWNNPPTVEGSAAGILDTFSHVLDQGGGDLYLGPPDQSVAFAAAASAIWTTSARRFGMDLTAFKTAGPYYGLLIEINEPDIFSLSDGWAAPSSWRAAMHCADSRAAIDAMLRGRIWTGTV